MECLYQADGIATLLREWPVLRRADFVLTKDPRWPYKGTFCGKTDMQGGVLDSSGLCPYPKGPKIEKNESRLKILISLEIFIPSRHAAHVPVLHALKFAWKMTHALAPLAIEYHSTENHYITSRYFSESILSDVM